MEQKNYCMLWECKHMLIINFIFHAMEWIERTLKNIFFYVLVTNFWEQHIICQIRKRNFSEVWLHIHCKILYIKIKSTYHTKNTSMEFETFQFQLLDIYYSVMFNIKLYWCTLQCSFTIFYPLLIFIYLDHIMYILFFPALALGWYKWRKIPNPEGKFCNFSQK